MKTGKGTTIKIVGKVDAAKYIKEKGYPEVGSFVDQKGLQKFYKQVDTATLEDWAKLEGLTYKACPESEPIHRMRVCMAILGKHFPSEKKSKPVSKYAAYTTEQLVSMAIEHDVPVEVTDDDRIMRMRTIMALRAAKKID